MNYVLQTENLTKQFGDRTAVKNVSMQIKKGDIYGFIGKNGAGKTTLMRLVLGAAMPTGGSIKLFDGRESESEARHRIGALLEYPCIYKNCTALENLRRFSILTGSGGEDELEDILELVGLGNTGRKKAGQFSLGMKQRLGIANAMLGNPELLILDEPTNGLDPQGIADVRALVQRLNREYGMTVIISSHILGELQHTADRFGIVNNGTVARVITQADLLSQQNAVRIHVDDLEKAKLALQDAGVQILDTVQETRSLEDFYFDLVGGEKA